MGEGMALPELTYARAKPAAEPFKIKDGDSLYMYVRPSGTKVWRVDYRFRRSRKTLTLGQYPKVTLVMARTMRDNAKRRLQKRRPGCQKDCHAERARFLRNACPRMACCTAAQLGAVSRCACALTLRARRISGDRGQERA